MSRKNKSTRATKPRAEWRIITPAEAQRMLDSQLNNRHLNERRVAQIADDIVNDRYSENGETVKITHDNHLIDGQHRLAAIVKANKPVTTLVVLGLSADVMPTIDQGKSRTNADVLGLLGVNNATQAGPVARALWEYDKFGGLGLSRGVPPRSQVIKTYKLHAAAIQDGLLAAHPLAGSKIFKRSVGAIIHCILKRKSSEVDKFFKQLFEADPATAGQGVLQLRRFIHNNPAHVRTERLVAIAIKAWNSWITETRVENLSYRFGEAFPDVIGDREVKLGGKTGQLAALAKRRKRANGHHAAA